MDSAHDDGLRGEPLLARVHAVARARHLSERTEDAYRSWIVRFVRFNGTRHPAALGEVEVRAFLESLATDGKVAAFDTEPGPRRAVVSVPRRAA